MTLDEHLGFTYHWNSDLGAMYKDANVSHGLLPYDGTIKTT